MRAIRRSLEINAWLVIAGVTWALALYLLRRNPDWSPKWKVVVDLLPILPGLQYVRKGIQFLRDMDELQRRIQFEAFLFAGLGTVVVSTMINVFNSEGLTGFWPPHGLEVGGTYLIMYFFWGIGNMIGNLRYR
jgi:hypothetical protein